jgi:hypothetical protein
MRNEVSARMAGVVAAKPNPLGATREERQARDWDWMYHTPEGKKLHRQYAWWKGYVRRARAAIQAEVVARRAAERYQRRLRLRHVERRPTDIGRHRQPGRRTRRSPRAGPARPGRPGDDGEKGHRRRGAELDLLDPPDSRDRRDVAARVAA